MELSRDNNIIIHRDSEISIIIFFLFRENVSSSGKPYKIASPNIYIHEHPDARCTKRLLYYTHLRNNELNVRVGRSRIGRRPVNVVIICERIYTYIYIYKHSREFSRAIHPLLTSLLSARARKYVHIRDRQYVYDQGIGLCDRRWRQRRRETNVRGGVAARARTHAYEFFVSLNTGCSSNHGNA